MKGLLIFIEGFQRKRQSHNHEVSSMDNKTLFVTVRGSTSMSADICITNIDRRELKKHG
jgi:hypothetical protein